MSVTETYTEKDIKDTIVGNCSLIIYEIYRGLVTSNKKYGYNAKVGPKQELVSELKDIQALSARNDYNLTFDRIYLGINQDCAEKIKEEITNLKEGRDSECEYLKNYMIVLQDLDKLLLKQECLQEA
ncbi:MAG: hypothetical protein U9Q92_05055 [archaeon]|nr:hypothetical protein [archaeon]